MLQCTHWDRHAGQLDIDRTSAKLGVRRDAVEALHHIQIAELRDDQRSLAAAQRRGNGTLRTEQRFAQLDVTTKLDYKPGEPVQVLRHRVGHDVAVLRSAYHAPRSKRQAADEDEPDIRLHEAREQLIEQRTAQRARRAASRNSKSLRVSKMVSLRFTASGRRPSARSRSFRTCSPCESRARVIDVGSVIIPTLPTPPPV